jgi:hypothetical protein
MMPTRRRTRARQRAQRIIAERNLNRRDRLARHGAFGDAGSGADDPTPF